MLFFMMFIIFFCGLAALVSGKMPRLIVGKKYRIEGAGARILGAFMMIPMPLSFMFGVVLFILLGDQAVRYSVLSDTSIFVVTLITMLVCIRLLRKPVAAA